jgi:hypothetical protein
MKTGISLLLQSIFLIVVLAILIDGVIKLPDIETIHIIIRAVCVGIVAGNFSLALHSYMKGN